MAVSKKLLSYLDRKKAAYKLIKHRTVYTAYDAAKTMRAKLDQIAKTLVVKADRFYLLAVLPATRRLDLGKLKKITKAKKLEIAKENVMKKVFKTKPGAVVPFGELYKVPVFIDKTLLKAKQIIAGAGTHEDSLVMTGKNFLKAVGEARVADFGSKSKKK
jgi:Ala-tRNA(Pro) deacylase